MGHRGEIIIDGDEIFIDESGSIYINKTETDTFRIALFENDTPLRKQGDNLFYVLDGGVLPEAEEDDRSVRVIQGYPVSYTHLTLPTKRIV